MKGSQRGSALIWWVIVLIILFMIAAILAYTQVTEKERSIEMYASSQAELKKRMGEIEEKGKDLVAAYQLMGFTGGETGVRAVTKPEDVRERIKSLQAKFPTQITATDTMLEAALKGVEAAYDETATKLKDQTAAVEVARVDADKSKDLARSVGEDKDKEITKLNASIKEEQDRGARNQQTSTQTIDTLRNRITELEAQKQKDDAERKKAENELSKQILAESAKVQQVNDRNKLVGEKDVPDGSIIDASQASGIAWIDVGTRHGLLRGTRFQVFELGKGGQRIPKGWIEVRELRDDTAVCGITATNDPLRPIVAGDLISNPYFARDKKPVFVFLGDLPGRYNKDEATRILRAKGAKVEDQVTAMTDFLVVGQAPKSETPTVLEDTPTFLLAREYGIQMLTASELQKYIQY